MGSHSFGRSQPTGAKSPSAPNAAHAATLSTATSSTGTSSTGTSSTGTSGAGPAVLAARNSAAASVAAATDAVASPVTSKADGRTVRGPDTLSRPDTSAVPPASSQ